ncbi:MAG: WD40/YVTN/BNR-like repeat-containing protein, partial [Thermomicrobiales bacterium]
MDLQVLVRPGQDVSVLALTTLGVFSSDNKGQRWTRFIGDNAPPLTQSLVVGYEADPVILLGSALGLFRAAAGYTTWEPLFTGLSVDAIGLPRQGNGKAILLASTIEKGLLVSDDGGVTWNDANAGLNYDPIVALAFSPLYARDETIFLATDSDIFRSRNGGKAWRRLELDVLPQSIQCLSISMRGSDKPILFVGSAGDGLWSSHDMGTTWKEQIAKEEIRNISVTNVPGDDGGMIVVTGDGLYLSTGPDQAWQHVSVDGRDVCCAIGLPSASSSGVDILVGQIEQGVAHKSPGSDDWTAVNNGLEASSRTQLVTASCEDGTRHCLIANDMHGRLLLSYDQGNSWVSTPALPSHSHQQIALLQQSPQYFLLVTTSDRGAFAYESSSHSWVIILDPTLGKHPLAVVALTTGDEVNQMRFLAIMADGEVLYRVPGRDWESAGQSFGDNQIVAVELMPSQVNPESFWAIVYSISGTSEIGSPSLWNTQDGGLTWTSWMQSDSSTALVVSSTFPSTGHEVVFVGIQNSVYRVDL